MIHYWKDQPRGLNDIHFMRGVLLPCQAILNECPTSFKMSYPKRRHIRDALFGGGAVSVEGAEGHSERIDANITSNSHQRAGILSHSFFLCKHA